MVYAALSYGVFVVRGLLLARLLDDFDGAEYLVHHLGDDGVAVGFEGFGAPLSERKGKAVHIKGKPIISSVNRGDRREVLPAFSAYSSVC